MEDEGGCLYQGYYGFPEQLNINGSLAHDDVGSCSDFSGLDFEEVDAGSIETKYDAIIDEIVEFK